MSFNHYAKIKRILMAAEPGWVVRRISEPTESKTFKGETRTFGHYYRVFDRHGNQIPYCKFQQLDLFTKIMDVDSNDIVVFDD